MKKKIRFPHYPPEIFIVEMLVCITPFFHLQTFYWEVDLKI